MKQEDFFIKYRNIFLDLDGIPNQNPYQCVDPIKAYFQEVLNVPIFKGNAIDYWKTPPQGFQKIKKGWFNSPNPGDLIIWDIKPYGHIGIANWTRIYDMGVFEQNNPIGSPCHFGTHNYWKVLGWLRPIPKQEPVDYTFYYLSDTDDISEQVAYCDQKFKEFCGMGVKYIFKQIPKVESPTGQDLDQFKAIEIVDSQTFEMPHHGVVLGYHGSNSSQGYKTYMTSKGTIMTDGYKPFPKEVLLFELKHQNMLWYNTHRKSNPFIESVDNYKSEDGGLSIVKAQLEALRPYLNLFKIV